MVLFNSAGELKRYNSVKEILDEFYAERVQIYSRYFVN